jgi:hypothetical protein
VVEADGGGANAGHSGAEDAHRNKRVRPKAERIAATLLVARFGLSQRRVCQLVALDRNTLRYRSRRALRPRMRELAETKRLEGCPRIYLRLRRVGGRVNYEKIGESIGRKGSGCAVGHGRSPRRSSAWPGRCPANRAAGLAVL